jgi:hypothetical protein
LTVCSWLIRLDQLSRVTRYSSLFQSSVGSGQSTVTRGLGDWYVSGSTFKRLRRSKIQAALRAVQLLHFSAFNYGFTVFKK